MNHGARRALVLGLALACVACRASEDDCAELARHVAELAEAEAKTGAGTVVALETSCKTQRPTKALVQCMMAAESLAEVDAC